MRNGKKILLIPFTLQILLVFAWAVLADLQGENSYFLIPKNTFSDLHARRSILARNHARLSCFQKSFSSLALAVAFHSYFIVFFLLPSNSIIRC